MNKAVREYFVSALKRTEIGMKMLALLAAVGTLSGFRQKRAPPYSI